MLELRASILSPRALVGFDGGRPLVRDVFVVAASGLNTHLAPLFHYSSTSVPLICLPGVSSIGRPID